MDKDEIIKLAKERSERLPVLKTQEDLKDFTRTLTKFTVEGPERTGQYNEFQWVCPKFRAFALKQV